MDVLFVFSMFILVGFFAGYCVGDSHGYEEAYTHMKAGTLERNMQLNHKIKWAELNEARPDQ